MMPIAIVAILLTGPAPGDDLNAIIEPHAQKLLKTNNSVGFIVGVRRDGWSHVFGYGTVTTASGKQLPARDTLFEIGSITKTFTGILLAEAVRRGEVTLDKPAQGYLPGDVPLPMKGEKPITLLHLATHRSGLPVEPPFIGLSAKDGTNPYADFDRRKLTIMLNVMSLMDAPGEKHIYSNLGTGIAGIALVSQAKAANYDQLVKRRICVPLAMTDTAEALTGAQRARLARGHLEDGTSTGSWDFACLESCGGLRSTADDMLRYAAANLGESKSNLTTAMNDSHSPRAAVRGNQAKIGLYWQVNTTASGETLLWHNGGTYGYRSMLALVPARKTAVIVLCASAREEVDATAMGILKDLLAK